MPAGDVMNRRDLTRRSILAGSFAAGIGWSTRAGAQDLPPTPACHDGEAPTLRQTEGPFFKPRSPERADLLEPGIGGRPVELAGLVLSRSCRPLASALVDLWHADDHGDYDNAGFRLRGHQFADGDGRWRFRTILPSAYEGRTRHFHVKVQAPRGPLLTTQLYFPGEPKNRRDGLFRPELLMRVAPVGNGLSARFDFVLDLG
jgi:protocatechuate 3,4-dioxygenase beta subunit